MRPMCKKKRTVSGPYLQDPLQGGVGWLPGSGQPLAVLDGHTVLTPVTKADTGEAETTHTNNGVRTNEMQR